ncbi:MAG: hypothetical protein IPJ67_00050 [Candidatus Moraniibacteriota bacterium]|nr:MAG: hypothetical protein IPJ67_00050 [Candidatus Moranbacteria bacterium]
MAHKSSMIMARFFWNSSLPTRPDRSIWGMLAEDSFGDTLSRILKKCGYDVSTEYYVNDAGEQVAKLGHSVLKDTEAVYGGEYIDDLGKRWARQSELRVDRSASCWSVGRADCSGRIHSENRFGANGNIV